MSVFACGAVNGVGRVILNAPVGRGWRCDAGRAFRRVRDNAPYLRNAVLASLFVLVLSPSLLRAETTVAFPSTPSSGVTVRLATPLTQLPHFGFLPLRVFVENLTASDGTWDLNFQVGSRGISSAVLATSFSVSAPAGQTRETWIYVPIAQAGFAINAAGGGGPGRLASGRVIVTRTATGMTVTRNLGPGVAMVTEVNEITGELKRITPNGGGSSTSITTPPPGRDLVFTIDPATGNVSTSASPQRGASPKYTIVTSGAGGAPAVTITPTPSGTKVKRVFGVGPRAVTEEYDFDTTTGVVTVSRTLPNGTVTKEPPRPPPSGPGMWVTFVIDPLTGEYRMQTRTTSSAQTVYNVVVGGGGAGGGGRGGLTVVGTPGAVGGASAPLGTAAPLPITAEIAGPGFSGGIRVVLPNNSNNTMRPFAVTAALESNFRAAIAPEVRGAPNISGVTLAQLPADWRIWSGFAGLILTSDEFNSLDAARRGALRGWVGMGGQIFLFPSAPGEPSTERVGAGRIVTLKWPAYTVQPTQFTSAPVIAPELRDTLGIYAETPALPDRETLFLKNTLLGDEIEKPGSDNAWVAVFLVVFAAVIGPVNLFAFAQQAKRHCLFLPTPALSLLGGVVLVATIFLQDGIGGAGKRSTLVVLLPGQNQAAVFQEQVARTGFLMKRTFTLDDGAIFAPLAVEASGPFRGSMDAAMARRADGQGGGDWFQSRSRPAQLLRQLTPTRGRVERVGTGEGGAPIVESSLATVLKYFVLNDADGKVWSAEKIQPGERVTLKAISLLGGVSGTSLGGSRGLTLAFEAATAARANGTWTAWGGSTEVAPVATLGSLRWGSGSVAYVGVAETRMMSPAPGGAR